MICSSPNLDLFLLPISFVGTDSTAIYEEKTLHSSQSTPGSEERSNLRPGFREFFLTEAINAIFLSGKIYHDFNVSIRNSNFSEIVHGGLGLVFETVPVPEASLMGFVVVSR